MSFPFRVRSHFSLLEGFCHIDDLVERASEKGFKALALTDIHSLSGIPTFKKECEKNNIKPILGCELRIKYEEGYHYLPVLCKNKTGWENLIKIIGRSEYDGKESYVTTDIIQQFPEGIIGIQIEDHEIWISKLTEEYINPSGNLVAYIDKEDADYLKILLCTKYKKNIHGRYDIYDKDPKTKPFFETDDFYLRTPEDYNTGDVLDRIEDFSITQNPILPEYRINGVAVEDSNQYLLDLCREGWVNRKLNEQLKDYPELREVYGERIKNELSVFTTYNLSNYMLIVKDFIDEGNNLGHSMGLRGSAAGCLTSYLIGISDIDPVWPDKSIPYHPDRSLIFERFLNAGRFSDGQVSPPDIDIDMGPSFRPVLIDFCEKKYGKDNVSHIITFGRMKGPAALKAVFRILEPVPNAFQVCNEITKYLKDEAKVQDELEDLRQDNPKYNIVNFCIDNIPEIAEFYSEYTNEFDMAIKLANTVVTQSKHAAGIVIADENLYDLFPMAIDPKTGDKVVSLEMQDAESCGAVKYDFLCVQVLDKIDQIAHMVNNNILEVMIDEDKENDD